MENKKRLGKCPNTAFCSKGQNEDIIRIAETENFVCPSCGAHLEEVEDEIVYTEEIIIESTDFFSEEIILEDVEEPVETEFVVGTSAESIPDVEESTPEEKDKPIEEDVKPVEELKKKGNLWLTALVVAVVTVCIIGGVFLIFKKKLNAESEDQSSSAKTELNSGGNNRATAGNASETLDPILFNEAEMTVFVGETNRLPITINDMSLESPVLIWTSDNEDVIMVNQDGVYYAQSPGTANVSVVIAGDQYANRPASIQVTVELEGQYEETPQADEESFQTNEIVVPAQAEQIEMPARTPVSKPTEEITIKSGRYEGDLLNGKPHGMGTIHYSKQTLVDDRDPQKIQAQPGDYFTGEFFNGRIVRGKLFSKNKEQKASVVLGRAN